MVSFLPIILMGVLFGLAMDYEVFLVSPMREDYVHGHDAQHAIRTGFISSARVVTAAAIIMISRLRRLHPRGELDHQADRARPGRRRVRRRLPGPDDPGAGRDGAAGERGLVDARAGWTGAAATSTSRARPWSATSRRPSGTRPNGPVAVRAEAVIAAVVGRPGRDRRDRSATAYWSPSSTPTPEFRSALAWTLSGWHRPDGGELAVLGHVLPEEAGHVRKKVRVLTAAERGRRRADGAALPVHRLRGALASGSGGRGG